MKILINALKNREIDPDKETIALYGCHHNFSHTGEIDESANVPEAVQKQFFLRNFRPIAVKISHILLFYSFL
jgi:hypothetical protein